MFRSAIIWVLGSFAACAFGAEPAPANDAAQCGVSVEQYARPAIDYLCDALVVVERYSLTVGTVDWPAIKAKAVAEAEAAEGIDDVHPIIRSVLRSLGDRHSTLIPARRVAQLRAPTALADHAVMVPGAHVAYIDLRGFFGTHRESMHAYVRALWADLARAETSGACAYIVDLRRNRGGNMWPSLLAMQPLLGVGTVGAFRARDDSVADWGLEPARATLAGTTVIAVPDPPASMEAAATRPVAVLLGAETASSGEAIAIAFRARPSTRSFGYHTYGATTSNTPFALKDGAAVNLAIADSVDRTGARYAPFVAPDEETYERIGARPGGARDVTKFAALEWLREAGCRQPLS